MSRHFSYRPVFFWRIKELDNRRYQKVIKFVWLLSFNLLNSCCWNDNYDQEKSSNQDFNYIIQLLSSRILQEVRRIIRLITKVFLSDDVLQQVFILWKCGVREVILNAVRLQSSWVSDGDNLDLMMWWLRTVLLICSELRYVGNTCSVPEMVHI
jgi:hypothetical protein